MSTTEAEETIASTQVAAISWDGRTNSYRPGPGWRERLSAKLPLHEEEVDDLDPITYEVIRHRLWTINTAHGEMVTRISGSPVFASLDFNMSILTEDAEVVMNAPFIQFLNIGAPYGVRFIMEKYGAKPGIEEGDIFVGNDPWIGAVHQMDVLFACPVFVDGQLFAWVSNAGHQYDLGGVVPGGWPQSAVDVYQDPTVFSPFKIVEHGELRPDLEAMYLRQSRMPDMVALDFRGQLSGCQYAARQIQELCAQFGAGTVKSAMRRIIGRAQEAFAEKLRKLPDGRWSEVRYLDQKLPEDRHTYRVQVNLTKQGDRLALDNEGTAEQTEGPLGITFLALAGSILSVLSVSMLHEQLFAIGGAERQLDYDTQPGLLNCVQYPAAVSAGILNVVTHMGLLQTCINRMLACDDELRQDVFAAAPDYVVPVVTGTDDRGGFYGSAILDHFGMGGGARAHSDGVDTGGPSWSPLTFLLNAESVEQWYPMIYLWRREATDTGGAGRWRGGVGLDYAWTPYRANDMTVVTFAGGMSLSAYGAEGILGGLPSPRGWAIVKSGTDLLEQFARRQVPATLGAITATREEHLAGKSNGTPLGEGDVIEAVIVGGGGYGDPLDREPVRVADDLRDGYVSSEAARSIYGVMLNEDGSPDESATGELRATIRSERSRWKPASTQWATQPTGPAHPATGEAEQHVHEAIVARDDDGERVLACARCGQHLCGYGDDYKAALLADESPITIVPRCGDPAEFIEESVRIRRYCCPGCQLLMTTEVVLETEPVNPDMRLV